MTTLNDIDAAIDRRRLLTHPFYRAWEEGRVTTEALRDYAAQYYFVESSLTELPKGEDWESEKTHPALWLKFANALGLSDEEVKATPMRPATKKLVDFNLSHAGKATANAALYAYESQATEIAETTRDSLEGHYGMTEGTQFFHVHAAQEPHHAAAGRKQLEAELSDENLRVLEEALELHWNFLSQEEEIDTAAA